MKNNISARQLALKVLYRTEKEKAYSNIALDEELNKYTLDAKDIGLASTLVYGTITWKLTLDEIIKKHSKIKLNKISIWILNILRLGIYQIVFLNKIPHSAAVNECVKLARRYGHSASSGFVNAVLRNIAKEYMNDGFVVLQNGSNQNVINTNKDSFSTDIDNSNITIEKLSIVTSHPKWLVKKLIAEYNIDFTVKLLNSNNKQAPICIRVNTLKTTKQELMKKLQEKGINCEQGILNNTIYINNLKNIANLEEFKQGLFIMQDEAATLSSSILNPKQGENVLDCCSAPGGKTTHLAEIMNNTGTILAWDLYQHRINLVNENCNRLGINIVKTQTTDASIFEKDFENKFDKILLDAPCSGLGVIRRKPDIKWLRSEQDISQIKELQMKILNNVCKYLKTGGQIVYSTCTILKEENEDIIEQFLREHEDFRILRVSNIPENLKNSVYDENYIKLYPHINNTDGFFISLLEKF